jgi:hypothetical protein
MKSNFKWKKRLVWIVILVIIFNIGVVKMVFGAEGVCKCNKYLYSSIYIDGKNSRDNSTPPTINQSEKPNVAKEADCKDEINDKNILYDYKSCKWWPLKKYCCCTPTDSASVVTQYSCLEKSGYAITNVCGNDGSKTMVVKDMPAEGKCDSLAGIKQTGTLSNDATTMGISVNQLKINASTILNPAGWTDPSNFIGTIIKFLYFAVGATTLIFYIWAGALWMTAGGNAEMMEKSKKILIWTSVGVVGVFLSYMITKIIFDYLTK